MKPPTKRLTDLKPKVARRPPAKVLTPAEKAAFLASRPDLNPKG